MGHANCIVQIVLSTGSLPRKADMMPIAEQAETKNRLLRALSPTAFANFAPYLEAVMLPLKHVLVEMDRPTEHVCFITSGLASMVATSGTETIEVGHIGFEGMTGEHLALMSDRTPNRTFMQVAGTGYLMRASVFTEFLNDDIATRKLFVNYVQSCTLQLAHSALSNGRFSLQKRLARWLLMVHDRTEGDDLRLTHKFLGIMLGVRRSGVTDQLHILEGTLAIKATRGNVHVNRRSKLEEIAGASYGTPEREYNRLIDARS